MLFKNAYIFTEAGNFRYGSLRVENGKFTEILETVPNEEGVDLHGGWVIPGLVDIHIHGSAGADFSDGEYKGLMNMAVYLAKNGVTSFAPTSMTLPYETLGKAYETAAQFYEDAPAGCARLTGIHMEGPFFSEKKKGAQNSAYLKTPDSKAFETLYEKSKGLLRIVDVAAELPGAEAFTREVSSRCTVSITHTDAGYEDAVSVFNAGATHMSHLYNGMPGLHHRNPGPIGAGSERDTVVAELICDGLHVHPSAVRAAFKLFPGRICMISDALRCCGMPEGEYLCGEQWVFLRDGVAKLESGVIAGSATNLFTCMQRAVSFGIPREQAILAATAIPAKQIGSCEIGVIAPGRLADFVVCTENLDRVAVYMGGRHI